MRALRKNSFRDKDLQTESPMELHKAPQKASPRPDQRKHLLPEVAAEMDSSKSGLQKTVLNKGSQ